MKKIVIAILLLGSSLCAAETVDKILAIVNDEIITQSDSQGLLKKLKGNGLLDDALLEMYDRAKLTSDNRALLSFLIDERALDSEVKRQGIIAPIEQVEGKIREIARARGTDMTQLRAALKSGGISYAEYQDFIKTSIQRQTLLQKEVTSKIKISDEDVQAYYVSQYSHSKALTFEYTLSHIVFLNKNGGKDAAQKKAQGILNQIKSNALTFENAAAKFSEDGYAPGGFFGTFKLSDFDSNISTSLAPLNVGEISSLVSLQDGYRIFKVNKKTLVASPDLERRREEIRARLLAEQFRKQFRVWLDQKRKDSYLHLNI